MVKSKSNRVLKNCLRNQRGVGVFQLGVAVLLLALMSMLIVNIYVVWLAKDYNKRICEDAAMAAGKAAIEGKPTRDVIKTAMESMETCGMGGYFIERPTFTNFRDDIKPQMRKLTIEFQTRVRLPAPYLVFDNSLTEGGLKIKDVYVYNVKNPKNCKDINSDAKNAKNASSKGAGKEATAGNSDKQKTEDGAKEPNKDSKKDSQKN